MMEQAERGLLMSWFNAETIEGAGVVVSIVIIIFLIRRGWQMYLAMGLATVTLAASNGNSIPENLFLLYESLTSATALFLVSMVIAISLLGHLHQKIKAMERLVENLRLMIRDPRALLMIFPAAVSFFSAVPGGAIISAPMVKATGRELKMSAVELAMSNMVYRHMLVVINPFNSSLILASGITGISIAAYLRFTVPVILVVFVIAAVILFTRYPKPEKTDQEKAQTEPTAPWSGFLIAGSPYLLALLLGLACGLYFPLAMAAGIAACLLLYLPPENKTAAVLNRLATLRQGFNWPMILATLGIVFYKDFMLEAESFQQAVRYLVDLGLPLVVLIVVLPFITGFITGHNAASLGIALPVLIPFLGPEMLSVRYFGLIYLSSYAGYLGSPVHLCTYLTNEYFKTPLYALVKGINVYGIMILSVALILSLFY